MKKILYISLFLMWAKPLFSACNTVVISNSGHTTTNITIFPVQTALAPTSPLPTAQTSDDNNSSEIVNALLIQVDATGIPDNAQLNIVINNVNGGGPALGHLPGSLKYDITSNATGIAITWLNPPSGTPITSNILMVNVCTLTSLFFSLTFDETTQTLTLAPSSPPVGQLLMRKIGNIEFADPGAVVSNTYATVNRLAGSLSDLSFNRPPEVDTSHKVNYVSLNGAMFYVPTAIALTLRNNTRTTGSNDAHSYGDTDYPDDEGDGDFSRTYADSNARHVTESQNSNTRTVPSGTTTDVFDTVVGVEPDPAGPTVILHDATFTTGQLVKITNLDDTNDLTVTATPSSGFPSGFFFGETSDTIPPHQTHEYVAYANTDSQESSPPAGWLILRFVPGP